MERDFKRYEAEPKSIQKKEIRDYEKSCKNSPRKNNDNVERIGSRGNPINCW